MSSAASSASWLPVPFAHRAAAAADGGRHLAADVPGGLRIAAPDDLTRAGRHTESEWDRTLHDPRRDELDAFEWLGFGQG